ncbi:uncharacterized protein LOC111065364 [Drosophila obscura]|uniref:uncharacterized protein LOC111065364 n=1 Tax=Drosophila obscura TaxID=7282 RepID=UPI001BB260B5|nr:uncharacterized protein LOC111065364 [Drosophila obscura]XP_022209184.2 uncharacterized protein LOC111065364 [Drosophila obscura]XP_022209185.2 uncharacterized protein LOC111065364 [Drosophila obscura]XP_022209186.2 uncharacterized protein LOC111065364 [Drosophila obscura]
MGSQQQHKDLIVAEFIASLDPARRRQMGRRGSPDFDVCLNVMMNRPRTATRFTLPSQLHIRQPIGIPAPNHFAQQLRNQGGGDWPGLNLDNVVPAVPRHQMIARIGGGDAELVPAPALGQGQGQVLVHGQVHGQFHGQGHGGGYQLDNNELAPHAGGFWLRHRAAMNLNIAHRGLRGVAGRGIGGRGQGRVAHRRYQPGDGTNGGGAAAAVPAAVAVAAAVAAAAAAGGDGPGVGQIVAQGEDAQAQLREQVGAGDGPAMQQPAAHAAMDLAGQGRGDIVLPARRRPRHRHIFNIVGHFLRDINRRRLIFDHARAQILQAADVVAQQQEANGEPAPMAAEAQEQQEPIVDGAHQAPAVAADDENAQPHPHPHGFNVNEYQPEMEDDFDASFVEADEDFWAAGELEADDDNAEEPEAEANEIVESEDAQQQATGMAGAGAAPAPVPAPVADPAVPLDRLHDLFAQIQECLATIVQQVDSYKKILQPEEQQHGDGDGDDDGEGHGDGGGDAV